MAYSAALKRAGAMVTEEGKAAARMGHPRIDGETVSSAPNAWKTPKEWGNGAEQRPLVTATENDQSLNERLTKVEELLQRLFGVKEGQTCENGEDRMETEDRWVGKANNTSGPSSTKKRLRSTSEGSEKTEELPWMKHIEALEQRMNQGALNTEQELGKLTTTVGTLKQGIDVDLGRC
jgi:hypothetical protein